MWAHDIKNEKPKTTEHHAFHIVNPSPWPFFSSIAAFIFLVGTIMIINSIEFGFFFFFFGFFSLISFMFIWWADIVKEGTFEQKHSLYVIEGFRLGFQLFIASEIMFFFGFFWAFFYAAINPNSSIGCVWPPIGILVPNFKTIPLLNTFILITSGYYVTYCHHLLQYKYCDRLELENYLDTTLILGVLFTMFQLYEYVVAPFNISDSIYGSSFYMATGFHGFHVLVGTLFLFICSFRFKKNHLSPKRHLSFELAIWYWHFVDVVWIFLYLCIYYWPAI